MDVIERLLNIFRRRKNTAMNQNDNDYGGQPQGQLENVTSGSTSEDGWRQHSKEDQEIPSAGHDKLTLVAGYDSPNPYDNKETRNAMPAGNVLDNKDTRNFAAAESASSNNTYRAHEQEVPTANQLNSSNSNVGGYQDVSPAELIPIEGHPGHFTNGGGKGAHDPTTGNSFGTLPVFDGNGKFLGESTMITIGGVSTNYGYSYGTPNPENIDLSVSSSVPYPDVPADSLIPVEGYEGQFTNGQGKGGHDPVTGNSHGTYPVYDANGKFLGENATTVIDGVATNSGYSYGTNIPENIDLGTSTTGNDQDLQPSRINIPIKGGPGEAAGSQEWVQHSKEDSWANSGASGASPGVSDSMASGDTGKGGVINGVASAVPAGMVGTPNGLVMNQETALRSAGLDMTGLADFEPVPNKGGPLSSQQEPSKPTNLVPNKGGPMEAIEASVASPYDQEVATANVLDRNASNVPTSQQRLDAGRQQRLDPDGLMGGYNDFGRSEDPNGGIGGDSTAV